MLAIVSVITIGVYVDQADWRTSSMIRGDAHGYCAYLASWVIYHDFTFHFYQDIPAETKTRYWLNEFDGTKPFPKLTMGVAMLQLPSYLIAHAMAGWLGYEQDGWSPPYHFAVGFSGLLAFLLGLWLLLQVLRRRFSMLVSNLCIIAIAFATNAYYYGVLDGAQSHIYSFMLLSAAIYGFDNWVSRGNWKWLYLAAICFGWMVLIRPTNGIFMIYPLVYLMMDKNMVNRVLNIRLFWCFALFILPLIPQFIFWKMVSGQWLFYSYGDEKIFWSNPHILEGLFSFRNGWLLYTPIMVFALIGIPLLRNIDWRISIALVAIISIHIYIVFSWWCWYYGSSLSIRPMIDVYPLLAFGLAASIRFVLARSLGLIAASLVLLIALIMNNTYQTDQYVKGQLSGSDMSAEAFKTLFFNANPPSDLKLLGMYKAPDTDCLRLGKNERVARDTIMEREWKLDTLSSINRIKQFGPTLIIPANQFETPFDRIMHAQIQVKPQTNHGFKAYFVMSFDTETATYGYHTVEIHKQVSKANQWKTIDAYLRRPPGLPDEGEMRVYGWFQEGNGAMEIKGLTVQQLDCPYREPL